MNPSIILGTEAMWTRGYGQGVTITSEGIALDHLKSTHGYYMGEIIDSMTPGHEWSHMRYEKKTGGETTVILWAVALDSLTILMPHQYIDLDQVIRTGEIAAEALCEQLKQMGASRHENVQDILLYDTKGRYLLYWFEIMADGPSDSMKQIEIFYEKFSWLNYLPQIYSEDSDFLERYLAVFQTIHEDIETVVDQMAQIYMPEQTKTEFLDVLNRWLPIDGYEYWNEQQRRHILANYTYYNSIRGTRKGIEAYVTLYTEETPLIVEYMSYAKLKDSAYHRQLYSRIYTDHPHGFTLLLRSEVLKDRKRLMALKAILRQIVPVQVSIKIARMNAYMVLDDYVYLGINSVIGGQNEMKLDEASMLSMSILGNENERG